MVNKYTILAAIVVFSLVLGFAITDDRGAVVGFVVKVINSTVGK